MTDREKKLLKFIRSIPINAEAAATWGPDAMRRYLIELAQQARIVATRPGDPNPYADSGPR